MKYLALIAVAALIACGVDGPPERPTAPQTSTQVSVSGEARIGVVSEL